MVFGSRGSQTGHYFNVIDQKGIIKFLDGQAAGSASLRGFKGFSVLCNGLINLDKLEKELMIKINYEDARRLVVDYLQCQDCDIELILLDNETITEDFGWVFFYNSKKYQETGDFRDMLGGNAPIIVDNSSGKITETGTAYEIQHYIEEYRANL